MHYCIMVVGEKPEKQLEPFQENNMEDCPKEYMEFEDHTAEVEAEWKTGDHDSDYSNIDDFAREYHGYEKHEGKYGFHGNPNSKWDWYQFGGRYANYIVDKEGDVLNQCYKKDIDIGAVNKKQIAQNEKYWGEYQSKIAKEPKSLELYKGIYGVRDKTKEEYVSDVNGLLCYGILVDGKWIDRDDLPSEYSENADEWTAKFNALYKGIGEDQLISIIDIHN